jgi:flagellar biosynthetic protein FliR
VGFAVDLSWLYATFLLSLRLSPVWFMTPLLGASYVPGVVKGLLSLGLASAVVSGFDLHVAVPANAWGLLRQAGSEVLIGALLGFGVQSAFGALAFAGRLLDTQMGFGLAGLISPMTRQRSALTGMVFELLAVAYVYAVNGHHMLLQAFVFLLDSLPLGKLAAANLASATIGQFGALFLLALALAAPLMVTLFVLDLGIALISRSMPQFNAFVIAMPVKVAVGVLLLALLLPRLGVFFERWLSSVLDYWGKLAG